MCTSIDHDDNPDPPQQSRVAASYIDYNNVLSAVDGVKLKIIRTDETSIRLHIIEYRNNVTDWFSLCGIALTLLVTLVTGTFKDFYFSSYFWSALISVAFIISIIRLIDAVFKKYIKLKDKDEVDIFIERLKNNPP